ncbi:MAG: hypothetical protein ACR2QW_09995 [bacterium]
MTKNLAIFITAMALVMFAGFAFAGCYQCELTLEITEITEHIDDSAKDIANGVSAVAAIGSLQYNLASNKMQWGLAGACFDSSSDDCGFAGGIAKRYENLFITGAVGGASNERVINFTISGSF